MHGLGVLLFDSHREKSMWYVVCMMHVSLDAKRQKRHTNLKKCERCIVDGGASKYSQRRSGKINIHNHM